MPSPSYFNPGPEIFYWHNPYSETPVPLQPFPRRSSRQIRPEPLHTSQHYTPFERTSPAQSDPAFHGPQADHTSLMPMPGAESAHLSMHSDASPIHFRGAAQKFSKTLDKALAYFDVFHRDFKKSTRNLDFATQVELDSLWRSKIKKADLAPAAAQAASARLRNSSEGTSRASNQDQYDDNSRSRRPNPHIEPDYMSFNDLRSQLITRCLDLCGAHIPTTDTAVNIHSYHHHPEDPMHPIQRDSAIYLQKKARQLHPDLTAAISAVQNGPRAMPRVLNELRLFANVLEEYGVALREGWVEDVEPFDDDARDEYYDRGQEGQRS